MSDASNTFSFSKDGKFLSNQLDASISVSANPAAAACIAANTPFPGGTTKVGNLSAKIGGQTGDLKFGGGGQGTVSFTGSAGATSLLAAYGNSTDLLKDLDPDPKKSILEGLKIDGTGVAQFILLDWGYDISASLKGSVALGGGASATFGADGSSNGLFAVIRGFANLPNAQDAIQNTIGSWMLPRQVGSADDLQPGTWLIAEVDGSIAVKIGAQYGYNFNWIRKVDLGTLSGDVGLKIQAAVDAAVGFNASGKYLLVVARESVDPASKVVRVRVYKMASKGWDFAFNASIGVTGNTGTLLPAQIDDFIAAVFGVHGAQVVEDLKLFDKWTDPATPLPDLLAGFVADFATKELGSLAGDQIAQFQAARQKVSDFLKQWEGLGHTASTELWSAIQKAGGPVTDLLDFLKQTNGLDDTGLKAFIETELGKTGFLSNPIGQWLEAVTANDVLSVLNSSALLAQVRSTAQMVLSIADGKVLDNLVQFVDQKLHIAQVEKIVSEADFNNLDPWLKSKLAAFLGKPQALFADLDEIRAAARAVRDKATALYQAAIKALNNTYTAALHYTYAKTTTSTALLDVSFDFDKNPSVGAFMKLAIQGDFTDLLFASNPGITLKSATLTHSVKRQSHVQVVLPYFSDTIDHINNSLVTMNVVEDKGRLFVYDLKASDQVIRTGKWCSTLTLTGKFTVGAGVRVFLTDAELSDSMTFSYGFRQSLKGARDVQLENVLEPLVGPYFRTEFGGPEAPDKASLHEWIGILDNRSTDLTKTASSSLGNVLLSLDVSLPGKAVAAWFNAPADKQSPVYLQMSQNIQVALRRYTQFAYFNDPARYHDIAAAPPIFVYGCLPLSTDLFPGQIYFDFEDLAKRQEMVFSQQTADKLMLRVSGIRDVLRDSDKFKSDAGFYDPHSLNFPLNTALSSPVLHSLLFIEAETIKHAQEAALKLAAFSAKAGTDPQLAIQALTDFGAKITDAFNHGLGSLIPRLDEFSSMIFLEAARALDPSLSGLQPMARLDTIILKPSATASVVGDFLSGTQPDTSVIALEQPVIALP